jgi:hypothetical protein
MLNLTKPSKSQRLMTPESSRHIVAVWSKEKTAAKRVPRLKLLNLTRDRGEALILNILLQISKFKKTNCQSKMWKKFKRPRKWKILKWLLKRKTTKTTRTMKTTKATKTMKTMLKKFNKVKKSQG